LKPERWDVALIPCTRGKNPVGVSAATLYRGGTFSLIMRHAAQRTDRVLIVSALHGIIPLDFPMRYYDRFLLNLSDAERSKLIETVRPQMEPLRGLRVLSYLWIPYHQVLFEANAQIAQGFWRPYLGLPTFPATLQKTLTREVSNYGQITSRR